MMTIVDYGVGNIRAFLNAFKLLNIPARTTQHARELHDATKILLPGVGAFDNTMQRLNASGLRETLDDLVMNRHVPVLGVCVGMQMLAGSSEEGVEPGLGWIDGRVRGLRALDNGGTLRLPHMGWNDVRPLNGAGLFATLDRDARFYFLHSFYFECSHAADVAAVAHYGKDFSCAVHRDNIYGVQFHPEKSHHFGTALLKNFATL
jgi:imidazole glycerol-phosphate synthase subunit HisH